MRDNHPQYLNQNNPNCSNFDFDSPTLTEKLPKWNSEE